jgi:hypothetical protein
LGGRRPAGWWCGKASPRPRTEPEGRLVENEEEGRSHQLKEEEEGRIGGATSGHTGARRKTIRRVTSSPPTQVKSPQLKKIPKAQHAARNRKQGKEKRKQPIITTSSEALLALPCHLTPICTVVQMQMPCVAPSPPKIYTSIQSILLQKIQS